MANTIDFPFSKFAPEADRRGYAATKYSGTGYFVKSTNGVRCEFQTTNGGVCSVGYGSSAAVVEELKKAVVTCNGDAEGKLPLTFIKALKGSVNFAFDGEIENFFKLVSFVETVKLPEKGKGGRPAGSVAAKAPKAEKVAKPGKVKTKSTEPTKEEKAKLNASVDAPKQSTEDRMALIKAAAEKARKNREAAAEAQAEKDSAVLEDMAPDMSEIPSFLQNDITGGRQAGAE